MSCQKEGSEYIQLDSRCPYVVQCKTSYRYPLYPNLIGTSINYRALFDIKERFIVSECVRCAGFNEKLLFHHKNKSRMRSYRLTYVSPRILDTGKNFSDAYPGGQKPLPLWISCAIAASHIGCWISMTAYVQYRKHSFWGSFIHVIYLSRFKTTVTGRSA